MYRIGSLYLVFFVNVGYGCFRLPNIQIPTQTTTPTPTTPSVTTTTTSTGCQCGVSNPATKIVGGVETAVNEFPWQVGLVSATGSKPYCGGTIISDKEILTAAHCTRGTAAGNIYTLVGEHDLTTNSDSAMRVRVCSKSEHPSYNSNNLDNDFSILTLCSPLTFSKTVSPVCLPTTSGAGSQYEGVSAIVSGWGTTSSGGNQPDQLYKVGVVTMSNSACCSSPINYACSQVTSQMMCASNPSKDSCQGDSGGPLVTKEAGRYTLIGVVSWGFGCAQAAYPGVYSRVTSRLSWITAGITGSTCPPP